MLYTISFVSNRAVLLEFLIGYLKESDHDPVWVAHFADIQEEFP